MKTMIGLSVILLALLAIWAVGDWVGVKAFLDQPVVDLKIWEAVIILLSIILIIK
jgi:hypothetical protein